MTEVIRTRFWSVNLRLRCVRELNNTQSILRALFLPQTKIYPTEILRPPSAYLRDVLGAEDEVRYSPCEDDKPKRAVNTRSEAGSDNFCHPSRKRIEPIRFSRKISGLYFGKNPYNIDILSRIFPSSILTDLYVKTACTLQRANFR